MNETTDWLHAPAAAVHDDSRQNAEAHQATLTKPPGSLGSIEQAAITLAALQGTKRPSVDRVGIVVFAADHGVAAEGVSAFPQAVTAEMIKNFAAGGAAISVLARALDADLQVVNLGTVTDPGTPVGVVNIKLGPGTCNFCREPAMSKEQLVRALQAGRQAMERSRLNNTQLFIGGEMGIANTTAATALACALLDTSAERLTGPGTGLDKPGVAHKTEVIRQALALHRPHIETPLEALRRLGGFEIAALTGGYIACAQAGLPVLVDGFISSVAALAATRLCPDAVNWFLFAHISCEPGHRLVLEAMNAQPLLDLGMRLGEASGAAIAVPLLRLACTLHNEMATFAEAGVSEKNA
ncbi:MAG: nicotinate-nucleotide--dimethylbenzimidazole phosphoribosyltransferase [Gammaproteobacteria bacterium]|nr:nicotinate-nucleotide--dimethylbenzimidazole phosphoribosyltransferase [Gammaproteobacteria bacterium]